MSKNGPKSKAKKLMPKFGLFFVREGVRKIYPFYVPEISVVAGQMCEIPPENFPPFFG